MAVPMTALHGLRVLLQCQQNLTGLQHDMRANAQAWASSAGVAETDLVALVQNMQAAAAAYLDRLGWVTTLRADAVAWGKVTAIHAALGGLADDFDAIELPLRAAVQQIQLADKSSAASIAAACAQVLASVDAPLSLWPE